MLIIIEYPNAQSLSYNRIIKRVRGDTSSSSASASRRSPERGLADSPAVHTQKLFILEASLPSEKDGVVQRLAKSFAAAREEGTAASEVGEIPGEALCALPSALPCPHGLSETWDKQVTFLSICHAHCLP